MENGGLNNIKQVSLEQELSNMQEQGQWNHPNYDNSHASQASQVATHCGSVSWFLMNKEKGRKMLKWGNEDRGK